MTDKILPQVSMYLLKTTEKKIPPALSPEDDGEINTAGLYPADDREINTAGLYLL
jgi:hypothetical protein